MSNSEYMDLLNETVGFLKDDPEIVNIDLFEPYKSDLDYFEEEKDDDMPINMIYTPILPIDKNNDWGENELIVTERNPDGTPKKYRRTREIQHTIDCRGMATGLTIGSGSYNIAIGTSSLGFKSFDKINTDNIYKLINKRIKSGYTYDKFTGTVDSFKKYMTEEKDKIESRNNYDTKEERSNKIDSWNNKISALKTLEYKLSRYYNDTNIPVMIKGDNWQCSEIIKICNIADKLVNKEII